MLYLRSDKTAGIRYLCLALNFRIKVVSLNDFFSIHYEAHSNWLQFYYVLLHFVVSFLGINASNKLLV